MGVRGGFSERSPSLHSTTGAAFSHVGAESRSIPVARWLPRDLRVHTQHCTLQWVPFQTSPVLQCIFTENYDNNSDLSDPFSIKLTSCELATGQVCGHV